MLVRVGVILLCDVVQIMVAEKKGVIRMYSTITLQPFMSLDCGHTLLVSADWSLTSELRVAALAGTDWFVFDTSRSRLSAAHSVTVLSVTLSQLWLNSRILLLCHVTRRSITYSLLLHIHWSQA